MVNNYVDNLALQKETAQNSTGPILTTTDVYTESVAKDEAGDQHAIQEFNYPDAALPSDSSSSTIRATPSNTHIRQISVLGERHSGTRWIRK